MSPDTPKPSDTLSVIVPAYDEEALIVGTLMKIHEHLSAKDFQYEILVVDDGSRDRTVRWANRWFGHNRCGRVIQLGANYGKGRAVRTGMLEARGDYRLFTDADSSTGIEEIDGFWEHFAEGFPIVIGSRALKGSRVTRRQTALRYTAGLVFRPLRKLLLLPGIRDTQCGFKCFRADAALEVFSRVQSNGFIFDVEALFIASLLGYRVAELPVTWTNDPDSKLNTLVDSARMLWGLIEIRNNHRLGRYSIDGEE
jgi:dolichyl-phosphate beta-glucosyltransferase